MHVDVWLSQLGGNAAKNVIIVEEAAADKGL